MNHDGSNRYKAFTKCIITFTFVSDCRNDFQWCNHSQTRVEVSTVLFACRSKAIATIAASSRFRPCAPLSATLLSRLLPALLSPPSNSHKTSLRPTRPTRLRFVPMSSPSKRRDMDVMKLSVETNTHSERAESSMRSNLRERERSCSASSTPTAREILLRSGLTHSFLLAAAAVWLA